MARIGYVPSEEIPLSEAIKRRKQHYVEKVEMTIHCLYNEHNYDQAELYEKALSDLSSRALDGKLEAVSREVNPEKKPRGRPRDPRPRLDFETYVEARKQGMSNEDIRTWFKTSRGFSGAYSRYKKKGN